MKIRYVITTFSPAMFGESATIHMRAIPHAEAKRLVTEDTRIVSTRSTHEHLARTQFPDVNMDLARYANLNAGVNAIAIHYRGPPLTGNGPVPFDAVVTFYLIEVEGYQET